MAEASVDPKEKARNAMVEITREAPVVVAPAETPEAKATADAAAVEAATKKAADEAAAAEAPEAKVEREAAEKVAADKAAAEKVKPKASDDEVVTGTEKPEELQIKFGKTNARRKESERIARETQARLDQALEAITRLSGGGKAEVKPVVEPVKAEDLKPEAPEFTDPETYMRDMTTYAEKLAGWSARITVKAELAEQEKRGLESAQRQNTARVHQEFTARRKVAIETIPDYVELTENPNLQITELMASAITADSEGCFIAAELGKNPAEADRISKLPPGVQLMELGAIKAAIVAARTAKPKDKLPAPFKPAGSGITSTPALEDLDMDAYAAKAAAEGRVSKAVTGVH